MKKLMVAVAIVCAAVLAQAATYNWKSIKGAIYQSGTTDQLITSGTAYLFDAGTFSQADLINALFVDKTYGSLAAAASAKAISGANNTVLTTGKINPSTDFTYDKYAGGTEWNAYFAVINGDEVFISSTYTATASDLSDASALAFSSPKTASQAGVLDGAKGFSTSGWYTSSSTPSGVPEPTSGLLLLLGAAGLALKRRRV